MLVTSLKTIMKQKQMSNIEKMEQLKKHFKTLKLRAILIWLAVNVVVDILSFLFLSIEITIFTVIITFIISAMIMINYLNRLDKIRITQETLLLEDTPVGRLKF